jgi:hypothetical protein
VETAETWTNVAAKTATIEIPLALRKSDTIDVRSR